MHEFAKRQVFLLDSNLIRSIPYLTYKPTIYRRDAEDRVLKLQQGTDKTKVCNIPIKRYMLVQRSAWLEFRHFLFISAITVQA